MKGKIVLVAFPFTDLTAAKLRSRFSYTTKEENDVILAFISSNIPSVPSEVDVILSRNRDGF